MHIPAREILIFIDGAAFGGIVALLWHKRELKKLKVRLNSLDEEQKANWKRTKQFLARLGFSME